MQSFRTPNSVVVYVQLSMELCISVPKHILIFSTTTYQIISKHSLWGASIFYASKPIYKGFFVFVKYIVICANIYILVIHSTYVAKLKFSEGFLLLFFHSRFNTDILVKY